MESEFTSLTKYKTWSLVRRDKAEHVTGSRWHFGLKYGLLDTYSPITRLSKIRVPKNNCSERLEVEANGHLNSLIECSHRRSSLHEATRMF